MAKCTGCGAEFDDGASFCPSCGKAQTASGQNKSAAETASEIGDTLKKMNDTEDTTSEFDNSDIENNKVMAILSYLWVLVLIPILAAPKSKFARFHANQGLVLLIIEAAWGIASSIVIAILDAILGAIFLGFVASIIAAVLKLINIVFLVLIVIGIVNAANGRAKKLPVIGSIVLLK